MTPSDIRKLVDDYNEADTNLSVIEVFRWCSILSALADLVEAVKRHEDRMPVDVCSALAYVDLIPLADDSP